MTKLDTTPLFCGYDFAKTWVHGWWVGWFGYELAIIRFCY